jgi:hypothetical protein
MARELTTEQYQKYREGILKTYTGERQASALRALNADFKRSAAYRGMQQNKALETFRQGSPEETAKRGGAAVRAITGVPSIEEWGGMDTMEKAAAVGNVGLNIAGVLGGVGAASTGARVALRNVANAGIRKGLAQTAKGAVKTAARAVPAMAGAFGTSAIAEEAIPDDVGPQVKNLIRTGLGVAGGLGANKLVNSVPGLAIKSTKPYEIPEERLGPKWAQKASDAVESTVTPGGMFALKNRAAYQEILEADALKGNISGKITRARDALDKVVSKAAKTAKKDPHSYDELITDYLDGTKNINALPPELSQNGDFITAAKTAMDTLRDYSVRDLDVTSALKDVVKHPAFRQGDKRSPKEALERARFLFLNRNRLTDAGAGNPYNPKTNPLTVDFAERAAINDLVKTANRGGPDAVRILTEAFNNPKAAQKGDVRITNFVRDYLPRQYRAFAQGENFKPDEEKMTKAVNALVRKKGMTREQAYGTVQRMVSETVDVENLSKVRRRTLIDTADETPELRDLLDPIKDWRQSFETAGNALAQRLGDRRMIQGLSRTGAVANQGQVVNALNNNLPSPIKGTAAKDAKAFREARSVNANSQYSEDLSRALGNAPTPSAEAHISGKLVTSPELLKLLGSAVRGGVKNPEPGAKNAFTSVGQATREWNNTARQALVGMNPRGAIRNALSDTMMMLGGGASGTKLRKNMKWAKGALKAMNSDGELDDLGKVAQASGVANDGFLTRSMPTGFIEAKEQGQNFATTAAKKWQKGLSKIPLLNKLPAKIQGGEQQRRLAFFKDQIDKLGGIDASKGFDMNTPEGIANVEKIRQAVTRTNEVLFDYAHPSRMTKFMNSIAPISSYTSNVYANAPKLMYENPGRYAALIEAVMGVDRGLEGAGMGLDASRILPMGGTVKAAEEMGKGKPASEALLGNLTDEFINPGVNMFARALDISRNRNQFGAKIANPKEGALANAADMVGYFMRPYIPGAIQSLDPIGMGGPTGRSANVLLGIEDSKGNQKTTASELLAGALTGLPIVRDNVASAQKDLANAKRNGASPRELAVLAELIKQKMGR